MTDAPPPAAVVPPPLPPKRKSSVRTSQPHTPDSPGQTPSPALSPRSSSHSPIPVVIPRSNSPVVAHRAATPSPAAQGCLSFLEDLHRARDWDPAQFATELAASFRRPEEDVPEASEATLARVMAAAGVASCGDPASQQRIVEAAAGTFDALALVPVLFRHLPSGAAAAELAAWAAESHAQDAEQRLFFGARGDVSPDVHTLVVEHFLERTTAAFTERLLPKNAGAMTAGEVWEGALQRLLDTFELPQALLFVARRLERPGPLAGLVLGSLLGAALARRAQAGDEAARGVYLGARLLALQLAAELSPAPLNHSLGRSGGSFRIRASQSLRRVEEGLRSGAGKLEAALHRNPRDASAARKSGPEAAAPVPAAPGTTASGSPADAEGDAVLSEAGVTEDMTHEQVRLLGLSEAREKRVVAELLRRPASQLCLDAMKALELEGLRFAEMRVLPLLPAKPPGVANRTLYKNYARLKFEYGQRSNVDQSAEQLVDDIFSDNEDT